MQRFHASLSLSKDAYWVDLQIQFRLPKPITDQTAKTECRLPEALADTYRDAPQRVWQCAASRAIEVNGLLLAAALGEQSLTQRYESDESGDDDESESDDESDDAQRQRKQRRRTKRNDYYYY